LGCLLCLLAWCDGMADAWLMAAYLVDGIDGTQLQRLRALMVVLSCLLCQADLTVWFVVDLDGMGWSTRWLATLR
jgi:hypothetical protein